MNCIKLGFLVEELINGQALLVDEMHSGTADVVSNNRSIILITDYRIIDRYSPRCQRRHEEYLSHKCVNIRHGGSREVGELCRQAGLKCPC